MSDTTTPTRESRETGTHGRSPLTWLVAAAAVVLIATAGVVGLAQRSHDQAPTATGSLTELGYTPAAGRCMLPSAALLNQQSVAFQGTLTTLTDGTATFQVTHWYAGGPTDLAAVKAPSPQLSDLVQAAHLRTGQDYLVSASHGNVTSCGLSGPARGPLLGLYHQAFGG
jgi:hypothetical protein